MRWIFPLCTVTIDDIWGKSPSSDRGPRAVGAGAHTAALATSHRKLPERNAMPSGCRGRAPARGLGPHTQAVAEDSSSCTPQAHSTRI